MKHYKTGFRFLIRKQIQRGLELKAFEPLAFKEVEGTLICVPPYLRTTKPARRWSISFRFDPSDRMLQEEDKTRII